MIIKIIIHNSIRNAILPKLITSELRVPDADKFIKEVELCI